MSLWTRKLLLAALLVTAAPGYAAESDGRGVTIVVEEANGARRELYGQSHALVIGVSHYNNGWTPLLSVPRELDAVSSALSDQGFTVTTVIDPDAADLEGALEEFVKTRGYEPEDRLLIYFAGHGYTRKSGTKAYLVPTDAPLPSVNKNEFLRKAVPMSQVVQWAREIEAKHALFLFDSCFSGTIFKTRQLPDVPEHISYAASLPVRQFITAGGADDAVPAASVFTPAFVDALRFGWADLNKDGYTTGVELGLYLHGEVPKHTTQIPQYGKIADYELSRGDFVFRAGREGATEPIPHRPPSGLSPADIDAAPAPAHPSETGSPEIELEYWRMAKASEDVDLLESYLDKYPSGSFALMARKEIENLAEKQQRDDYLAAGVVPDRESGLMWTRENTGDLSWQRADRYCKELHLAGLRNWRLPSLAEMQSIYDREHTTGEFHFDNRVFPIHTVPGFRLNFTSMWMQMEEGDEKATLFDFDTGNAGIRLAPDDDRFRTRAICVRELPERR